VSGEIFLRYGFFDPEQIVRGEAGPGLIAEDLPEVLPAVFRRLYDEFGIGY